MGLRGKAPSWGRSPHTPKRLIFDWEGSSIYFVETKNQCQSQYPNGGNSLAIRIPKHFIDRLDLHEGSQLEIEISGESIVIRPTKSPKYTSEQLLTGMTPEHFHPEINTGNSIGCEFP